MHAESVEKKKMYQEEIQNLKEVSSALKESLKNATGISLDQAMSEGTLNTLDQMMRAFQKRVSDCKQNLIDERRKMGIEDDSQETQKLFLSLIQELEDMDKSTRKYEEHMLQKQKEVLNLVQEIGERQMSYAHQLWDALEEGWSELSRVPTKGGAFNLKVQISKAIKMYEDAECLWYQIVDKRLLFLKSCKTTSYFSQLFQEGTYLNDLAMRSTEFCEKFRKNLEQLKLLPSICEEFFLIQEEVRQLKEQVDAGRTIDKDALKHDLYWMEKSVKDCMLHASAKNEFHKQCQATLVTIESLRPKDSSQP